MIKPKEIAILFKKIIYQNDEIEFIPIKVIEGIYDERENNFIDKDGTPYRHIIENSNSYGYCYRDSIANYKENHRYLTLPLIKSLLLRTIKKYSYSYHNDDETGAPIILFTSKKDVSESNVLLDEEIMNIYVEGFPEYYNKYLNPEKNETEDEPQKEIVIKNIYENMISNIIDQDETIKELISIICKQQQDIKTPNKNIILDGPSGVGKSKICKLLLEQLNIPSVTISARDGKMKCVEHLILDLVKMSCGDIQKAHKGIIIIDKFEDFIMYSSYEGRGELERLIEDNKFIVSSSAGEFLFDTSNLIIICLANFELLKPDRKQITGFNGSVENKKYQNTLDKYFTTIKLNSLNYDSYIKILNSEEGLLSRKIRLFNSQGIELVVSDFIKHQLALIAACSKYKAKTLESIIERMFRVAEFEILSNPNHYSELIITDETINNNKVYTLSRKNTGSK